MSNDNWHMFWYIFSLIDHHSTIKCKMLGLQFLTEVALHSQGFYKFLGASYILLTEGRLLRTLSGQEVGEGVSVGLGNHREDEEGVEGGDGGEVEEDSVRTKQRHEWFSELEGNISRGILLITFGGYITWTARKINANWVVIKVPVTRAERSGRNHSPCKIRKVDQGGSDYNKLASLEARLVQNYHRLSD